MFFTVSKVKKIADILHQRLRIIKEGGDILGISLFCPVRLSERGGPESVWLREEEAGLFGVAGLGRGFFPG